VNVTSVSSQVQAGRNPEATASVAGSPAGGTAGLATPGAERSVAAPVSPATELVEVLRAASRAQEVLAGSASSLKFTVDDKTGTVVVRVVDTETDQLIRQIPSEEMLAIARNMEQMQGLLVRREA
jgi:flagellar protein FlaG